MLIIKLPIIKCYAQDKSYTQNNIPVQNNGYIRPIQHNKPVKPIQHNGSIKPVQFNGPIKSTQSPQPTEQDTIKSLVLVDENANQVLTLLEQLTGKKILKQQDLPQVKINLNSMGEITKKDAILALESLLSMNGIAVVEMGNAFLKAVPLTTVQSQSPTLLGGSSLVKDPSQKIYSKIFKLDFLTPKEGLAFISGIGTKNASAQVGLEKSNAILVTDTLVNLQRIETLLNEMDKPLMVKDEILFYPLKYADAMDLKTKLEVLRKPNTTLGKYLGSASIEADKSSNQLIVVTHAGNKDLVDKIVAGMDVAVQALNKSEVIQLKHAKSKDVADLLKAVIKGQAMPKKEGAGAAAPQDTRGQLLERLRETVNKPPREGETEISQQFSVNLTLEPDERSNAIVAFGTPRDLDLVRNLIGEIDVLLPQVEIKVVIAEVTLTDGQVSGLQSFGFSQNAVDGAPKNIGNKDHKTIFKDIATLPFPGTGGLPALTFASALDKFALDTVFRVAQQNSSVKVLSVPSVVTTHNQKAIIKVVEDVPYLGDTITTTDNLSNQKSTVLYHKDVGIVLEVTPLIGPNKVIQMEIKQTVKTVSNASTPVSTTQNAPTISNREAQSFVSVYDQQVIVLGGLQVHNPQWKRGKVWLLGYIPILGDALFSPKSCNMTTTELIMFIKPHIIYNETDSKEVFEENFEPFVAKEDVEAYLDCGYFGSNTRSCECLLKEGDREDRRCVKNKKGKYVFSRWSDN